MAFPKFKPDFKHAMLGVGALAIAALPLVSGPSNADDGRQVPGATASLSATSAFAPDPREVPGFTTTELKTTTTAAADTIPAAATAVNYQEWDLPTPQAPTADRPYYYVKFDQATRDEYIGGPPEMSAASGDRLVVINFIDEQNGDYSTRQTELLENALSYLAPKSEAKELMLVDVIVRDQAGNMPYGTTYRAYYEENTLGPDGVAKGEFTLPYGVVYGEELVAGNGNTLYDFSLYNGAQTERDVQENSRTIAVVLQGVVTAYNQKKVASLDTAGGPTATLVASYD